VAIFPLVAPTKKRFIGLNSPDVRYAKA